MAGHRARKLETAPRVSCYCLRLHIHPSETTTTAASTRHSPLPAFHSNARSRCDRRLSRSPGNSQRRRRPKIFGEHVRPQPVAASAPTMLCAGQISARRSSCRSSTSPRPPQLPGSISQLTPAPLPSQLVPASKLGRIGRRPPAETPSCWILLMALSSGVIYA